MQLVLEFEEVEALLRQALLQQGIRLPEGAVMRKRINGKKQTMRIVFITKDSKDD